MTETNSQTDKRLAGNLLPKASREVDPDYSDPVRVLESLACDADQRTVESIRWYLSNKKVPKRMSQWVRGLAVLLFTLGGLAPLLNSYEFMAGCQPDRLGYIFIALGAAILGLNKFFGFDSTWVRYMKAQLALQNALEKFRQDWVFWRMQVTTSPLTPEQTAVATKLLGDYQKQLTDLATAELQDWVTEFQNEMAALQAAVDKGTSDKSPGTLMVSYNAQPPITGPVEVLLDDAIMGQANDGSVIFRNIPPGAHKVTVRTPDGKRTGSATVKLDAGQTTTVTVTLT
jgi:hypothetical protein